MYVFWPRIINLICANMWSHTERKKSSVEQHNNNNWDVILCLYTKIGMAWHEMKITILSPKFKLNFNFNSTAYLFTSDKWLISFY